jgi:hypothetical protein
MHYVGGKGSQSYYPLHASVAGGLWALRLNFWRWGWAGTTGRQN